MKKTSLYMGFVYSVFCLNAFAADCPNIFASLPNHQFNADATVFYNEKANVAAACRDKLKIAPNDVASMKACTKGVLTIMSNNGNYLAAEELALYACQENNIEESKQWLKVAMDNERVPYDQKQGLKKAIRSFQKEYCVAVFSGVNFVEKMNQNTAAVQNLLAQCMTQILPKQMQEGANKQALKEEAANCSNQGMINLANQGNPYFAETLAFNACMDSNFDESKKWLMQVINFPKMPDNEKAIASQTLKQYDVLPKP